MRESKHTPWAISPHPWPEQVGCCPLVGRPYSVHGTDHRNVAAATTQDIARLIAAAPEMLEALRDLAEAARNACDASQHTALIEALFYADAAIAKAEGRSDALLAARTNGEDNE